MIKYLKWGLIAVLLVGSPLIYTEIQSFMTINGEFPTINAFSAKSKTSLAAIIIVFNQISLALTATITILPCGYLARKQQKFLAVLFVFATQSIPVYLLFNENNLKSFIIIVMVGQFASAVIISFLFAHIGSNLAKKRESLADV